MPGTAPPHGHSLATRKVRAWQSVTVGGEELLHLYVHFLCVSLRPVAAHSLSERGLLHCQRVGIL